MSVPLTPLVRENHISIIKNKVPDLVAKVQFEKQPAWGQMTAQHMVEHLAQIIIFSTILSPKQRVVPTKQQEETVNFLIYTEAEFPHNIMNPIYREGLPPYAHETIEKARIQLSKNIETFFKTYQQNPEGYSYNPFTGDLNFDELLVLHVKHFRHHLKQFGVTL